MSWFQAFYIPVIYKYLLTIGLIFQNSLDEVESIMKRHGDFENTLGAQDKILKGFSDHADKLIASNHYDSP